MAWLVPFTSHTSNCSCKKSSAAEAGLPFAPGGKKAPAQSAVTLAKPAVPTWMVPRAACGPASAGAVMAVGAAVGASADTDEGAPHGADATLGGARSGADDSAAVVIGEMSGCRPTSRMTAAALRKLATGGVVVDAASDAGAVAGAIAGAVAGAVAGTGAGAATGAAAGATGATRAGAAAAIGAAVGAAIATVSETVSVAPSKKWLAAVSTFIPAPRSNASTSDSQTESPTMERSEATRDGSMRPARARAGAPRCVGRGKKVEKL